MSRKKPNEAPENSPGPGIERRMSYGPFFSSMVKTFAYTLLAFMGFLLLVFLLLWITKR